MKHAVTFLAGMATMFLLTYICAKIAQMDIPKFVWKYEP